jgi:hypothetical protein
MYEMVFELREFLSEHVYTCFFTNFYFEHAGNRLNEYSELSELDLSANPRIVMKPGKYPIPSPPNRVDLQRNTMRGVLEPTSSASLIS